MTPEEKRAARSASNKRYRASLTPERRRELDTRKRTPEQRRERHYRHRYGISAVEVDQRTEEQLGLCAICMESAPLVVDHDHEDGQVRGLLCQHCNRLLGAARDRAAVLERAADYLREYAGCKEATG